MGNVAAAPLVSLSAGVKVDIFLLNRFQWEYSYFILKLTISGCFFFFFLISTGLWRCQCQSVCAPLYPHSINIKLIFDAEVINRLPS